jgi:hypothetical protein
MGYWSTNEQGVSFAAAEGDQMIWGDAPADIMDEALEDVVKTFADGVGRRPTKAEIRAGLEFALGIYNDSMGKDLDSV